MVKVVADKVVEASENCVPCAISTVIASVIDGCKGVFCASIEQAVDEEKGLDAVMDGIKSAAASSQGKQRDDLSLAVAVICELISREPKLTTEITCCPV